jgi:hypothetical protein
LKFSLQAGKGSPETFGYTLVPLSNAIHNGNNELLLCLKQPWDQGQGYISTQFMSRPMEQEARVVYTVRIMEPLPAAHKFKRDSCLFFFLVSRLWAGRPGLESRQVQEFLFATESIPALGPTQSPPMGTGDKAAET